jgi:hypothetical protein
MDISAVELIGKTIKEAKHIIQTQDVRYILDKVTRIIVYDIDDDIPDAIDGVLYVTVDVQGIINHISSGYKSYV